MNCSGRADSGGDVGGGGFVDGGDARGDRGGEKKVVNMKVVDVREEGVIEAEMRIAVEAEMNSVELVAGTEECRAHRLDGPRRTSGQSVHGSIGR